MWGWRKYAQWRMKKSAEKNSRGWALKALLNLLLWLGNAWYLTSFQLARLAWAMEKRIFQGPECPSITTCNLATMKICLPVLLPEIPSMALFSGTHHWRCEHSCSGYLRGYVGGKGGGGGRFTQERDATWSQIKWVRKVYKRETLPPLPLSYFCTLIIFNSPVLSIFRVATQLSHPDYRFLLESLRFSSCVSLSSFLPVLP